MKVWWKATRNARQKVIFQATPNKGLYLKKEGITWFMVVPIQSTRLYEILITLCEKS
uniref:Uncharacterized protein n=1 Tax=Solanum lycopersicum TaxID=4081 RepID=A0A3Q7J9L9_SOLLC